MKKLIILFMSVFLVSCSSPVENKEEIVEEEIKTLPLKEIVDSPLMSESPLSPLNIDEYLFLDDVVYIDTRSPQQYVEEGHIAGFTNIPFYEAIAHYADSPYALFKMVKVKDENGKVTAQLGDVGSYIPLYEESEELLYETFPRNKQIVFIATAGVESCYLINLLKQYGYDPALLYNAGSFSNSLGPNIAYKEYENAKYMVKPIAPYQLTWNIKWGELTPIEE